MLSNKFKAEWRALRKELKSDYNLRYKFTNTKDHGIPRSRPRTYLVGNKREIQARKFGFPDAIPAEPMDRFLDDNLTSSIRFGPKCRRPRTCKWS